MVSKKIDRLYLTLENVESVVNECKLAWSQISEIQKKNQSIVNGINKVKNDKFKKFKVTKKVTGLDNGFYVEGIE